MRKFCNTNVDPFEQMNKLKSINASRLTENKNSVLIGSPNFTDSTNKDIINATISFILTTTRLNCPLFKN